MLYPVAPDQQGKLGVGGWVVEEWLLLPHTLGAHAEASPSALPRECDLQNTHPDGFRGAPHFAQKRVTYAAIFPALTIAPDACRLHMFGGS